MFTIMHKFKLYLNRKNVHLESIRGESLDHTRTARRILNFFNYQDHQKKPTCALVANSHWPYSAVTVSWKMIIMIHRFRRFAVVCYIF